MLTQVSQGPLGKSSSIHHKNELLEMLILTKKNIQKAVGDSGLDLVRPDHAPLWKNSVPLN
jgi:hypothetical protein